MLALGIFSLTGIPHLRSKQPELVSASVAEVKKGYRSGRLLGSNVVNDQNEKIGTITELVLGQDYALFAVLEIGSFLGLDTHLVAVPIRALVFEDTGRRVMLPGATRKALRNFPEFRFPG
jgi:PRC-barrel domain